MAPIKTLDCVALKNTIQSKLLKEYEGLQEDEAKKHLQQKLEISNSVVAKLWRQIEEAQKLKKAS